MPFYPAIKPNPHDSAEVKLAKQRTASRLVLLKEKLSEAIPPKRVDGSLLVATWNIRELGEGKFRGWAGEDRPQASPSSPSLREGPPETEQESPGMKGRLWESLYYMAEVIDRFDLVALQEVRDDLEDLNLLRGILGSWWKVLITDVTEGTQGNRERVAFLYDERKVKFGGLAGEVVLPPGKDRQPAFQLARTPYLTGFQAGWFRFTICSTHLYYGESQADDPQRLKEMDLLAGFLAREVAKPTAWAKNMILLGDFNIFTLNDEQYKVLTKKHGFTVPDRMIGKETNVGRNRPYDQIAFIAPSFVQGLKYAAAGIFPYFDHVFTAQDEQVYAGLMGQGYLKDGKGKARDAAGKTTYYLSKWRTFQMSDHNPLWIELGTDFSEGYLAKIAGA